MKCHVNYALQGVVLATKMVTAAANSKQGYQAAQKWLQRMEDAEFKPGKRQYTDLINAASKAGDLQAAEALSQFMSVFLNQESLWS